MNRGIGGTAFEPVERRRDRELTLGPTMLAALGLGLFTLCGVCFVFGYAVGQHGSPPGPAGGASALTASGTPAQTASGQTKPAASQSTTQLHPVADVPPESAANGTPAPATDSGHPAQSAPAPAQPAQSSQSTLATSPTAAPPVVHAVAPLQPSVPQPAAVTTPLVKSALPQSAAPAGMWMVQIAAVSHPEDAEVLVNALRKHGYAVAVHRDPADTLMHVQVGPFASHTDAAAMRQKLLSDGYNAIVQP